MCVCVHVCRNKNVILRYSISSSFNKPDKRYACYLCTKLSLLSSIFMSFFNFPDDQFSAHLSTLLAGHFIEEVSTTISIRFLQMSLLMGLNKWLN